MIRSYIHCRETTTKGWGMFTSKAIKANTLLEISPVVVMSSKEKALLDQTTLYNYIFDWEDDRCCMALGNIPIYNHASPSNCEYFQDYDTNTIFIKTVRDIEAGEELTINYNGDYNHEGAVWFDVKE
ncbi:MAG: SET domain-containing protein-lysine N-methyltransferase [Chitinophagaceae bacterium]|nr:SET domain-containing protein-lysine N-methyltransferase [Chitinophagaceae bacterium]